MTLTAPAVQGRPALRHPHPPDRGDAARDGDGRRSATTSSARTPRSAPSRSGSPSCSATRTRSSPRRGRWPTSSASACTSPHGAGAGRRLARPRAARRDGRCRRAFRHLVAVLGGRAAGCSTPAQPLALMIPDGGAYQVATRLVVVENTHNFGGGTVQPLEEIERAARGHAATGASRCTSTAPGSGTPTSPPGSPLDTYGRLFDTVSVCLSKGLGAPVGSLLAGSARPHAGGAAVAQALRRRDAPGRHPRRGRACTPSTTTSSGWPTTTPAPTGSPRPPTRPSPASIDPAPCRPTSWSSTWPSAGWASGDFVARGGGRAAYASIPSAARRCASSGTSTSTTPAPTWRVPELVPLLADGPS